MDIKTECFCRWIVLFMITITLFIACGNNQNGSASTNIVIENAGIQKETDFSEEETDSAIGLRFEENMYVPNAGPEGTTEYLAALEWIVFMNDYCYKHVKEFGNSVLTERTYYDYYSCYDDTLKDRFDAILHKYQLLPHQSIFHIDNTGDLYSAMNISPFINSTIDHPWGYYYDDGSFKLEAGIWLKSGKCVDFDITRCVKGVMCETYKLMGDTTKYRTVSYETERKIIITGFEQTEQYWVNGRLSGFNYLYSIERPMSFCTIGFAGGIDNEGKNAQLSETELLEILNTIQWEIIP